MTDILDTLAGGDRRSIGKAGEVAAAVLAHPELFASVFAGLSDTGPRVRMRAADAIEKISRQKPELLQKFKRPLLESVALIEQQEVQWHVAQMIPRLQLSESEVPRVRDIIAHYLETSTSNIVCVMSLQALAELAWQGWLSHEEASREIEEFAVRVTAPSVRARAKKLLKQLRSGGR